MQQSEKFNDLLWNIRKIRETSDELLNFLDKKDWYLPRICQMPSENRKREWLAVRVLLKELLGEEKEIAYTETGKPYLVDNSHHISISHTKEYVAVALSKYHSVGIDIEYISPRVQKISSRFMSDEETAGISSENEIIHLLLHWSAKESMFKALNEQSVDFREFLHIQPFVPEMNVLSSFNAFETKTENRHRFVIHYLATEDYVCTVTSISPNKTIHNPATVPDATLLSHPAK